MRTCVAVGAKLHLIKPLGFSLDENSIKRCAVNYLKEIDYVVYADFADFLQKNNGYFVFLSRYGTKNYTEVDYVNYDNVYLFFGNESKGIPWEILKKYQSNCYRIPTTAHFRSLNLANAVAIVAYEVMRQCDFSNLSEKDQIKGENFWL